MRAGGGVSVGGGGRGGQGRIEGASPKARASADIAVADGRGQRRGLISGARGQGRRDVGAGVGRSTTAAIRRGGGGGRWLQRPWLLLAVGTSRRRDGGHTGIDGRPCICGGRDPAGHTAVAAAHPVAVAGGGEDRGDGGKGGGRESARGRGRQETSRCGV